jgi:DNA mismatch endonuclease (patch repair protein)
MLPDETLAKFAQKGGIYRKCQDCHAVPPMARGPQMPRIVKICGRSGAAGGIGQEPAVSSQRSALMARIGPKNSVPEMVVRKVAHGLGYRYRLHGRDLPGTPDLVFPARRSIIFVHGCFWHRHSGCKRCTHPKTRFEFWAEKFARNVQRDASNEEALRRAGWRVLVIWECETFAPAEVRRRLKSFLGPTKSASRRGGLGIHST